MATHIRVDGDRWKVRLGRERSRRGVRAVLFFPVTSDQRPYRVVEVPEDEVEDQEALEALHEERLRELFDASSSLGVPGTYA